MAFVAAAAPFLAAASAGTAAVGAVQGGIATKNAMNYRAAVAKNNQVIAEQNREYALQSGSAQAATQALKGRAVGGAIKAKQAASGVDVNTGSAVDVQEAQREQSQLDVETVLNNANLSAYGYRVKGDNYAAEAKMDEAAGEQAETAGYLKGAAGLLGAASSLGGKWSSGLGTPSDPAGPLPPMPEDI
jgi:hypothetical protein